MIAKYNEVSKPLFATCRSRKLKKNYKIPGLDSLFGHLSHVTGLGIGHRRGTSGVGGYIAAVR